MLKNYVLRLLFLFLLPVYSYATNFVVTGAGAAKVNGMYKQTSIMNGKPYYTYFNPTNFSNYVLSWDGLKWQIVNFDSEDIIVYYVNTSTQSTPPLQGWITASGGVVPVPIIKLEDKTITSNKYQFVENINNDGSTNDTILISYNKIGGDQFSGVNGDDFLQKNNLIIENIPDGFKASVIRNSDSTLIFTLAGKVLQHNNENDISNIELTFKPSAFVGNDTVKMIGNKLNNFKINFRQAYKVASTGAVFNKISTAIAGVTNYDILELSGEVFTEAGIKVDKSLVFVGKGAHLTIVQAAAAKDVATERVFEITQYNEVVVFKDLTIRNGKSYLGNAYGGAVRSSSALEFYNCAITGNIAKSTTSGQTLGGGILCGPLKMYNCLVNDNIVTNGQGSGQLIGGGISCSDLMLVNSTVTGNTSSYMAGGIYASGKVVIINSTITNNSAVSKGGGIQIQGKNANIVNTIIFGNTAGVDSTGDLCRSYSILNIFSSIIQKGGTENKEGKSAYNGLIFNLIKTDPMLNALAYNGGPTKTQSLKAGSPAIDAGMEGTTTTDQRGFPVKGKKDIGAFELPLCMNNSPLFISTADTIKVAPGTTTYTIETIPGYASYMWSTEQKTPTITVTKSGKYTLTVTDTLKCTNKDSIVVAFNNVVTNVVMDENIGDLELFPNPCQTVVNIKNATGNIIITNMHGMIVAEKNTAKEGSIDVSGLNKGVYFLQTKNLYGETIIRKLMVE